MCIICECHYLLNEPITPFQPLNSATLHIISMVLCFGQITNSNIPSFEMIFHTKNDAQISQLLSRFPMLIPL